MSMSKALQYFKDKGSSVEEAKIDLSNIYTLENAMEEIERFNQEKDKLKPPGRFNLVGKCKRRRITNLANQFDAIKAKFVVS